MEKKISIKDIARHVGVSTALISYVLNNKEGRVSPEMAEKIRKAAAELNYRPNLIAKSLKNGKTNTLGLIVADISNPFFSQIARIVEDEAKKYGYTVIFGSSDESVEKSQDLIDALLNRQVDALIIAPAEFTEPQIRALQAKRVPFVLIDRYFHDIDAPCVRIDNYRASYDAVAHLIRTGSRRIGMVAYDMGMQHSLERKRGYRDALADNGIVFREEWLVQASFFRLEGDVEKGLAALLQGREPAVDALFFATNSLAVQGMRQIMKLGIRVPEKLAIVSFDEAEAFEFFYAPLSYVRQSLKDIGQQAVRLALEQTTDRKPETAIVEADLVIRESSGRRQDREV